MVRKNILVVLCLLMALTINAKPKKVQVPAVSVGELRTERMVNPMSLDIATPRLGWQIKSTQSDVKQTAYRLIVSSTLAKATKLEGDLWDTTVNTDQSQWITYAGKPLRSDTRCYWRVKVTTNKGESEWSDVALFNVGLLYTS
ncbi:MAG: alpha-rhamnosidase, partial [Prevotella sp.]|nr:alpha-rhamnosidase [Prevotella sp.]